MKTYKAWLTIEEYEEETEEGIPVGFAEHLGEFESVETAELFGRAIVGLLCTGATEAWAIAGLLSGEEVRHTSNHPFDR